MRYDILRAPQCCCVPHNAAAKMLCVQHPMTPQSSVSNAIMERLPVYAKRPCITAQLSSTSMLPA